MNHEIIDKANIVVNDYAVRELTESFKILNGIIHKTSPPLTPIRQKEHISEINSWIHWIGGKGDIDHFLYHYDPDTHIIYQGDECPKKRQNYIDDDGTIFLFNG